MRIASGVDIVDITRVQTTLRDPAQLQRMLNLGDISRHEPEHLAGRIALKEATIKALGLSPGSWLDIHIRTQPSGKPQLSVVDEPPGLVSLDGSISHHGDLAIAFVVALFDDEDEKEIVQ
jgi:phosphopantetheine--protein transferase-like protein